MAEVPRKYLAGTSRVPALRRAATSLGLAADAAASRIRILSCSSHDEEDHGGAWEACSRASCVIDRARIDAVEAALRDADRANPAGGVRRDG